MADISNVTVIQRGDAATPELFTTIAEVVSVDGPSMTNETADVTNLDSTWRAFLAVVPDAGEIALTLNLEPDSANVTALEADLADGSADNYQICWSNITDNNFAFVAGDVIFAADTITEAGHGLTTGQPIRFTTDTTLPDPLVAGTTYYTIWVNANTIKVATTNALAVAGTQIDLIDAGIGNHVCTYGDRYDLAASVSGFTPAANTGDKLTATVTLKVTGSVT